MIDSNLVWIALLAVLGAAVGSTLGWLQGTEGFDARKFASSLMRGSLAAIAFAATYPMQENLRMFDLLSAFLGGAGFNAVGNAIVGAIANRFSNKPTPPSVP